MTMARTLACACGFGFAICLSVAAAQSPPILDHLNPLEGVGPTSPVERLHDGLRFTEGPAADDLGNVYFTDIPANRVYLHDSHGQLSVFVEPSGHINGLWLDGAGKLIGCQQQYGRLVTIDPKTRKIDVIADGYQGKRFNASNDLTVDSQGGIYFTDPRYSAPDPWPQGIEAVYYRAPDGNVTRLWEYEHAPNGVILSPDEKTLYVIPSMSKDMYAFPIESPGKLGQGRVFCQLAQPEGAANRSGQGSGGDGLTVDTKGNLYITSSLGLQIVKPDGEILGVIPIPERPANVTFGGKDRQTLFVTARSGFYAVAMAARGHVFPGVVPVGE